MVGMKFWKVVEIILYGISMICFVGALVLSNHFLESRSKYLNIREGKIYRHEEHGRVVYITSDDKRNLRALFSVAGISFLLAIGVDLTLRKP